MIIEIAEIEIKGNDKKDKLPVLSLGNCRQIKTH